MLYILGFLPIKFYWDQISYIWPLQSFGFFLHSICKFGTKWTTFESKAGVAQLVERQLPKLKAVGSRPITRSTPLFQRFIITLD